MPRKSKHECYKPGCHTLTHTRYCEEHGGDRGGERPRPKTKAHGFQYGNEWKKKRDRFIADNSTCERCGRPGDAVHHRIEKSKGGPDEDWNLETLCNRCHNRARGDTPLNHK